MTTEELSMKLNELLEEGRGREEGGSVRDKHPCSLEHSSQTSAHVRTLACFQGVRTQLSHMSHKQPHKPMSCGVYRFITILEKLKTD